MEDQMTQTEFYLYLLTLARNIRAEAKTAEDAARILEELAEHLKPKS